MKVVVFQKSMGVMGAKGPGQQEPVSSVGRVGTGEMSNAQPGARPTGVLGCFQKPFWWLNKLRRNYHLYRMLRVYCLACQEC
jgi:hypothetical protein